MGCQVARIWLFHKNNSFAEAKSLVLQLPVPHVSRTVSRAFLAEVFEQAGMRCRAGFLQCLRSQRLINYDLLTPTGVPLASIFEGIEGTKLNAKVLSALLAEAKAPPHHPCTKETKTSMSSLLDIFAPRSVFALGCESLCTSHYNTTRNLYDQTCEEYVSVCDYGDIYEMGCEGAEFYWGDGSSLCGQYSCWNGE